MTCGVRERERGGAMVHYCPFFCRAPQRPWRGAPHVEVGQGGERGEGRRQRGGRGRVEAVPAAVGGGGVGVVGGTENTALLYILCMMKCIIYIYIL